MDNPHLDRLMGIAENSLTHRELDILVQEQLFKTPVLGYADCSNHGGWAIYGESSPESIDNTDRSSEPVYVRKCQCEFIAEIDAKDALEHPEWKDWLEPKIYGHYAQCLDVVPFYSESDRDALIAWRKLRETGDWCCLQIDSDYDYAWVIRLTRATMEENVPHEPSIVIDLGNLELAESICWAILEACKATN